MTTKKTLKLPPREPVADGPVTFGPEAPKRARVRPLDPRARSRNQKPPKPAPLPTSEVKPPGVPDAPDTARASTPAAPARVHKDRPRTDRPKSARDAGALRAYAKPAATGSRGEDNRSRNFTPRGAPPRDKTANSSATGQHSPHRRPPATTTGAPPRRPPAAAPVVREPGDDKVRVSKLLSERGLCSRREADAFMERGWVLVDGVKVTELGTRVSPTAVVTLAQHAQKAQLQSVTILLNKPIGYVSGQPEPGYTPAVTLIGPDSRWAECHATLRFNGAHLRGLAPAGRLDIDSTGLLVFTQDGRIARKLIGEDSIIEKEYLVRVEGTLGEGDLKRLNHGLSLDGQALKPAKVSWQNEEQLRFVLREGKKRQIRRMCELVGLKVVGLKRIRIGSVLLGKLPAGQWRYLREDERF